MEYYSRIGNGAHESRERKRSMRRSKSTCFKILTCSRKDPVEDDDDNSIISPPENKALSHKRRSRSCKQSTREHRGPSNSTTSDLGFVHHRRESREEITTIDGFHSRKNSSVPEKALVQDITNETSPLSSTLLNSEITVPPVLRDINPNVADKRPPETVVVTIQAAIRGYLARRELYKIKNVVKLQAAVRGHLVRRQAVGTLLCTHAIYKVQALVRARRARHLSEGFAEEMKDEKLTMYMESPDFLGKRNTRNNLNRRYSSTVKLLSNKFARQLLESTTKIKPIYISCDPSKSDSAWQWLERWMAVTTSGWQHQEHNYDEVFKEQEENSKLSDHETRNEDISASHFITSTWELASSKSLLPNEDEADSITKTSASFKFRSPVSFSNNRISSSLGQHHRDKSQIENDAIDIKQENDTNVETLAENYVPLSEQTRLHTDETSLSMLSSISCESPETEGRGSRKPFETAFAAPQSNSEDFSSTSVVDKSVDLADQDAIYDSRLHIPHSPVNFSTDTKGLNFADNPLTHNPTLAVTASEFGTETSISSPLDSPDLREAEIGKIVLEVGSLEKQNSVGTEVPFNGNSEGKDPSSKLEVFQPERPVKEDTNLPNQKSVGADVPFIGNAETKEPSSKLEVFQPERLVKEDMNLHNHKFVDAHVPFIGNAETKEPSSKLEALEPERRVKEDTNLPNQSVGADVPFIGNVEAIEPFSKLEVLQPERLVKEDTNLLNQKSVGADVQPERPQEEDTNLSNEKFVDADVYSIGNAEAEEPSSKLEVLAPERLKEEDTHLPNQKFVDADASHIGNAEAEASSSQLEVFHPERPEEKYTNLDNRNLVSADVSYIGNSKAGEPSSKLEIIQPEKLEEEDTSLHNPNFVGADVSFIGNAEAQDPSSKLEVLQPKRLEKANTDIDNQNFVDADVSFIGNSERGDPSSKLEVLQPERLEEKDRNLPDQNFVGADVLFIGNAEVLDPSSKLEVLQPKRLEKANTEIDNQNFVDADVSFIGNSETEDPGSKLEVLQPEKLEEKRRNLPDQNFVDDVSFSGNTEAEEPSSKLEVLRPESMEEEDTDLPNEKFVDADVSFIGNTEKEDPSSKVEVLQRERLEEEDKYQANQNFVGADVSLLGNAEAEDLSSKSEVVKSERSEEEDTDISSPTSSVDAMEVVQHSPGSTESDLQAQPENFINQQVESTLPEATPQSHMTASELIGTPSNKVSVNSSKNKKDSIIRSGKQRFQTGKKPPCNAKNDLNGRSSMEHLEKDSKSAKRRNSLGTIDYVHVDHEPRIISSNSLPSYMLATKSAMAKVQIPTKSSPDAHEKDNLMNKRHSLPIANGKQGLLPPKQRSPSKVQHELKNSSGTYSRLNSADRRWQI